MGIAMTKGSTLSEMFEAKNQRDKTINQGFDASDTELVKFIVANYPAILFHKVKETEQDKIVDLIAKNNGFKFYRTASVRKQVAYRFKNGQTKTKK